MRRSDTPGPWERTNDERVFVRAVSCSRNQRTIAHGVIGYEPGVLRPARPGHVMCIKCRWSFAPHKSGELRRHDCAKPFMIKTSNRSGGIKRIAKMFPTPTAAMHAGINSLGGAAPVATLTLPGVQ